MYNGKTIEEIEANLPERMPPVHRSLYIRNCREVVRLEQAGISRPLVEQIRNSNHQLLKRYCYGTD